MCVSHTYSEGLMESRTEGLMESRKWISSQGELIRSIPHLDFLGKPAHPLKQLLDKMGPNFEEGPEKDVQKKTIYPKISVLKIYDYQSLA